MSASTTTTASPPRDQIERMVRAILQQTAGANGSSAPAPGYQPNLVVNISARHCHLRQEDIDVLFGPGYRLTELKRLYQATDFAANETVAVVGPRQRMIPGVRILGPARSYSQVELAFTDSISLGIDVPVRMSGDIKDSPGCLLIGPKGSLVLPNGVIRAERHVHMGPKDAEFYGVKEKDRLNLRIEGPCGATLEGLLVRTHPDWKLEVHIDTDEANACDLTRATKVSMFRP